MSEAVPLTKVEEARRAKLRKETFRGKNLEELMVICNQDKGEKLVSQKMLELFTSKVRRRFNSSMGFKYKRFI